MASPSHDHSAPKGSHCAQHPERNAYFQCPRCGGKACVSCWHPSVERCQRCMLRDPAEAADPIPWERGELGPLRRFFGTLATAIHPVRSAPAFAGAGAEGVGRAWRFALLSALPAAMLAGIVPHTRTLLFADANVRIVGHPGALEIAIDVARAMLVEAALSALVFGCLFLPYVSLVRSYAPAGRHLCAIRALFYRAWLLPASKLFMEAAAALLPAAGGSMMGAPPAAWYLGASVGLVIQVLLMLTMGATARLACGLGPVLSFVVVVVPVLLMQLAEPLVGLGLEQLLPAMPALQ
jgi:hypothetical protein